MTNTTYLTNGESYFSRTKKIITKGAAAVYLPVIILVSTGWFGRVLPGLNEGIEKLVS